MLIPAHAAAYCVYCRWYHFTFRSLMHCQSASVHTVHSFQTYTVLGQIILPGVLLVLLLLLLLPLLPCSCHCCYCHATAAGARVHNWGSRIDLILAADGGGGGGARGAGARDAVARWVVAAVSFCFFVFQI